MRTTSIAHGQGLYTPLVRSPSGQPSMDQLTVLQRGLVSILSRRGLLEAPPAWLGFDDVDRWTPAALQTLSFFAYCEVVERKRPALQARLERWAQVDGVVRLGLEHFIEDRQRRHDRAGRNARDRIRAGLLRGRQKGLLDLWEWAEGRRTERRWFRRGSSLPRKPVGEARIVDTLSEFPEVVSGGRHSTQAAFECALRLLDPDGELSERLFVRVVASSARAGRALDPSFTDGPVEWVPNPDNSTPEAWTLALCEVRSRAQTVPQTRNDRGQDKRRPRQRGSSCSKPISPP